MNQHKFAFRVGVLVLLIAVMAGVFSVRLHNVQITQAAEQDPTPSGSVTYHTRVTAARGEILDRNGNVLVGNRASYNLVIVREVLMSADAPNENLRRLVDLCSELGLEYTDHFPVTQEKPYAYVDSGSSLWDGYFRTFLTERGWDTDVSAPQLIRWLKEIYHLPADWTEEECRRVISLRYELDLRRYIGTLDTYVFMTDVDALSLAAITELNIPGLNVETSSVRQYNTTLAAHILGTIGKMNGTDWETYESKGYAMDAYIGKDGLEQAFEEELHGSDGTRVTTITADGNILEEHYAVDPVAGNNIETTIDLGLQKVAEESLAAKILGLRENGVGASGNGKDAEGGAVVVMKVKTGEILACASYPTYNLATMNQDWAEIEADPLKPFFNRAFGANYAPGSTFKMCTLIAAMEHRSTNPKSEFFGRYLYLPGEIIRDQGVFTKYPGFSPMCLIYKSNPGVTHGELDAQRALEVSCNYFFYELGSRMTIEMLNETANSLGLGVPTGIELTEKVGWVTDEASKKAAYGETGVNSQITAGDRVLAAIGQAENRFSPLQLCVYASTLANKGTRMKATFLSRVVASDYSSLIKENSPEIMSQMEIASTTYNTYIEGMRKVIEGGEGTARSHFGGPKDLDTFPVKVCGKTGTAQHSSGGSDHGAFICFAPMEDPEIAVAVYGEKAAHGATLAAVAEDILRAYFAMEAASEVNAFENQAS